MALGTGVLEAIRKATALAKNPQPAVTPDQWAGSNTIAQARDNVQRPLDRAQPVYADEDRLVYQRAIIEQKKQQLAAVQRMYAPAPRLAQAAIEGRVTWADRNNPPSDFRTLSQLPPYGAEVGGLPSAGTVPLRGNPLDPVGALGQAAVRGYQQEIPVVTPALRSVRENVARPIGEAAGQGLLGNPLRGGNPDTGRSLGGGVGAALVPTTAGEIALELIPGVGTVPDVVRVLRKGGPEAAAMAARLAKSEEGQSLLRRLGSELGALGDDVAGKTPEELAAARAGADVVPTASTADVSALPPSSVPKGAIEEYVYEPELIFPDETALAKGGRPRLLPFAQSMEDAAQRVPTTPGTKVAGGLSKVPGAKSIIGLINRAALINADPAEALTVLYRRVLNQGEQGVHYGIDTYMRDKPFPFDLNQSIVRNLPEGSRFGPKKTTQLVPPGTKVSGFEGENVFDILERATRQDVGKHLTQEQWDWIVTTRTLIDDAVDDLLTARGIKPGSEAADKYMNRLGMKPGEHYFPRTVFGREGVQGAQPVSRGGGIGANKFYDRTRVHEYAAQGAVRGLDYDDPRVAVETFLMAMRRQTADEYLLQVARTVGKTRKQLGVGKDTYLGAFNGSAWGRAGTIPTREGQLPGLRGHFFPAEIIDTIERELTDEGSSVLRRLDDLTGRVRTAKAGLDAGSPMIQGLPLLARNPVAWGRSTARHFQAMADPAIRSRYLLSKRAMIQDYLDWGGELTTPEMFDAVRQAGQSTAGKVFQKATTRPAVAMDTFLDSGRIEMWEALSKGANDVDKPGYMGIVRNLLGTTSPAISGTSKRVTQAERIALWFSTRLTKSPVALAGHILGTRKNAQESLRTLAQFTGGISLVMYGLAKGVGMSDDEIGEMFNPNAGRKFMAVRVGDNYIGIGGTYRSLAQLVGMSYDAAKNDPEAFVSGDFERNPMLRWFRSRTSQITGTAITLGTGFDYAGRSVDDWQDKMKVVAQNFTPFTVDSVIEAEGSPWDKLTMGSASFLGLRTIALTSSNRLDIMRDREASRLGYTDFQSMQKQLGTSAAVAETNKNPEVKRWYEAARKDGKLRREERGEMSLSDVLQPFYDEQAAADADPELQDPEAWRNDRKSRRNRQAGAIAQWEKDNPAAAAELKKDGEKVDPFNLPPDATPDQVRAAYFKVFNSHATPTGGVDDPDLLAEDLEKFEGGLSADQQASLAANTGLNASEREKSYLEAVRVLDSSGYFDRQDNVFSDWVSGIPGGADVPRWETVDEFQRWSKEQMTSRGQPEQYYTSEPWWKSWQKFYEAENGLWLSQNPEADVVANIWRWQTRVHSRLAEQKYEEKTGLPAPVPLQ